MNNDYSSNELEEWTFLANKYKHHAVLYSQSYTNTSCMGQKKFVQPQNQMVQNREWDTLILLSLIVVVLSTCILLIGM